MIRPQNSQPLQQHIDHINYQLQNFSLQHNQRTQDFIESEFSQQPYTTSINELISEPIQYNQYSMQNIFSSLYQLSQYLFYKKIGQYSIASSLSIRNQDEGSEREISFEEYLKPLEEELNKYDRFKKNKAKEEMIYFGVVTGEQVYSKRKQSQKKNKKNSAISVSNQKKQSKPLYSLQSELINCYKKVPFIYFEQNFTLDFSYFQDKQNRLRYNNIDKMKRQQQIMNDDLDLIQINLFGQIHRNFQDYFKAAANFDYLRESITVQLGKIKQSRGKIANVQMDFVKKSQKLRQKIIQRTNYQKLIKKIQIIKSLKKLPSLIESILQSQFPFDCLSFLKQIKNSINQVESITSIKPILDNIKSCETIVQLGLNKRYTDELYMYIEQVFVVFDFSVHFDKITCENSILSKDLINNSNVNNTSRRSSSNFPNQSFQENSGIFLFQQTMYQSKGMRSLLKNSIAKRKQGKQYQIAMILLQSFQYIDFPIDVTKIKIMNGLRVICKKFQKDLFAHLQREINNTKSTTKQQKFNESYKQNETEKAQNDKQCQQIVEEVTIDFYTRHLFVLNQLFKEIINRYLGYVLTLVTEYQEKLMKMIEEIDVGSRKSISQQSIGQSYEGTLSQSNLRILQKSQKLSRMQSSHNKFKQILSDELGLIPSIFKIIEQKLNHFLTLKNISSVTPQQFYQWVSILRYWQKWFDTLTQDSPLLNYTCSLLKSDREIIGSERQIVSLGQNMMEEVIQIVMNNVKKSVNTINIKNRITELTVTYLQNYYSSILRQLHQGILQESWQSIQIPQQFSDVINNIISQPTDHSNLQVTILNSSVSGRSSKLTQNQVINKQQQINIHVPFKYKILKNYILIDGQRCKLSCSFLLLCEFIDELTKIGHLFMSITSQCQQSLDESRYLRKIMSCVYEKIYELIEVYNKECKEMILEKKVLKMERIKGNNITVKHICLLSNCLSFLQKLTKHVPIENVVTVLGKKERQTELIYSLVNHNILLIDKISSILNKKMQSIISIIRQQQKATNIQTLILQSNQSIVSVFLQITEIIDDCLDVDKCEKVLRQPFQVFVQKYFKLIMLKGDRYVQELTILLEKLKFLKKYFKNQFLSMQREIEQ